MKQISNLKKRCFISVPISEEIRRNIEKIYSLDDLKFVNINNLHITVLFLDLIDLETIEKIKDSINSIEVEPFKIIAKGVNAFLDNGIMFVDIEDSGGIEKIKNEIIDKIKKNTGINFDKEHKFYSHITFARKKKIIDKIIIKKFIEKYKDTDFGTMILDKIALNESILKKNGPEYKNIFIKNLN